MTNIECWCSLTDDVSMFARLLTHALCHFAPPFNIHLTSLFLTWAVQFIIFCCCLSRPGAHCELITLIIKPTHAAIITAAHHFITHW